MLVEIWSDVVCPWCYIGKRRFETALRDFEGAGDVEVQWRSFQLNPNQPKGARELSLQHLADKYGVTLEEAKAMHQRVTDLAAAEGLEYDMDRYTVINTFDAHRVAHLAKDRGLDDEINERFLKAQLVEGEVLEDADILIRLAAEVGVAEDETRRVLESDEYADEVEDDIRTARELGITGVPFFVIDRKYGVSGAQPAEVFLQALQTARSNAA